MTPLTALLAFIFTLGFVQAYRKAAPAAGLMGHPGEHRRHAVPTPLVGGIAIFSGLLMAVLVTGAWREIDAALAGGAVLMVLTGILDDRWELPFWLRFLAQMLAAWMMVRFGGLVLRDLGPLFSADTANLGAWAIPLTIFAAVGVINALNMVDGMDGLAGSLALTAVSGLVFLLFLNGQEADASALAVFGVAVAAFLVFNIRRGGSRARVFLGDAGSMLIGFVLAWFLVKSSQGVDRSIHPVTALWLLALPLFDAVGVLLRRSLRGRSPFAADRIHVHHLLLDAGWSVSGTLLSLVALAALLAGIGIAAQVAGVPDRYLFLFFLCLFTIYLVAAEWAYCSNRRNLARKEVEGVC